MALTRHALVCDTQEMSDAIAMLREIVGRVGKLHGDDFRRLDRRIHEFVERPDGSVKVHDLGEGLLLAAPDGELTEIFREARRLCIIG